MDTAEKARNLDEAVAALQSEKQLELQLVQDLMDARIDKIRAEKAFADAHARLMQFRSEQQEAA